MGESSWLDLDALKGEESQPAKRVAVQRKEEKMQKLNLLILSLQNAQMTRQLSGATWWIVLIPSELGKGALATTKAHAEKTKGQTSHRMGSPHIQLWRTLVIQLVEMNSGEADLEADIKTAATYFKVFEEEGPVLGHRFVTQAGLKLVKDPNDMVLFYSLSDLIEPRGKWLLDTSLHQLFASVKAEAPLGGREENPTASRPTQGRLGTRAQKVNDAPANNLSVDCGFGTTYTL
jgi:hypothetical protein